MGKGSRGEEMRGGLREVCLHWTSHCGYFRSASPQCKDAERSMQVEALLSQFRVFPKEISVLRICSLPLCFPPEIPC